VEFGPRFSDGSSLYNLSERVAKTADEYSGSGGSRQGEHEFAAPDTRDDTQVAEGWYEDPYRVHQYAGSRG